MGSMPAIDLITKTTLKRVVFFMKILPLHEKFGIIHVQLVQLVILNLKPKRRTHMKKKALACVIVLATMLTSTGCNVSKDGLADSMGQVGDATITPEEEVCQHQWEDICDYVWVTVDGHYEKQWVDPVYKEIKHEAVYEEQFVPGEYKLTRHPELYSMEMEEKFKTVVHPEDTGSVWHDPEYEYVWVEPVRDTKVTKLEHVKGEKSEYLTYVEPEYEWEEVEETTAEFEHEPVYKQAVLQQKKQDASETKTDPMNVSYGGTEICGFPNGEHYRNYTADASYRQRFDMVDNSLPTVPSIEPNTKLYTENDITYYGYVKTVIKEGWTETVTINKAYERPVLVEEGYYKTETKVATKTETESIYKIKEHGYYEKKIVKPGYTTYHKLTDKWTEYVGTGEYEMVAKSKLQEPWCEITETKKYVYNSNPQIIKPAWTEKVLVTEGYYEDVWIEGSGDLEYCIIGRKCTLCGETEMYDEPQVIKS